METQSKPAEGKAVASLVLGILAAACVSFHLATLVGIILGIIGLFLGISARKTAPSGMATAGIILSIVAITLCTLFLIACVACVVAWEYIGPSLASIG